MSIEESGKLVDLYTKIMRYDKDCTRWSQGSSEHVTEIEGLSNFDDLTPSEKVNIATCKAKSWS